MNTTPIFEVKQQGTDYLVWSNEKQVYITNPIPDKTIADEICDDFNKMSAGDIDTLTAWMGFDMAKRSIFDLEAERMAWSLETFPESTAISSLRKLKTEIDEIESDINAGKRVPEEYADALMCLFDSAGRHGIGIEEIFDAFEKKLEKNKSRTWVKNDDNSYSHVKL